MKILYSPQFNNEKKLEYYFSDNIIKAEESVYTKGENEKDILELSNTFYFDISNLEFGKFFQMQYPITQARIVDEELNIELLNFIKDDAPEEEKFPEWQEVEFEDFEIPEDAEIIQLEELIIPEAEPVVDQADELAKANAKIAELETYVNNAQLENEALVLSAIEMMTEMMLR